MALVDEYPKPDSRVEANLVQISGGGPAANAAVVLARQGESVSFVGQVCDDSAGQQALTLLKNEGVDVSGVAVLDQGRTQASCIIVDQRSGTRAISTQRMPAWNTLGQTARQLLRNASWIHTDHLGFNPVKQFFKEEGITAPLSLDAGNPVHGLDLEYVTLYVPTVQSLLENFGVDGADVDSSVQAAIDAGAKAVVATDGANGSYAWWSDEAASIGQAKSQGSVSVPADSQTEIVSTLGAGDVFHGALIAALLRSETWEDALRSANFTASLSCRALDGREAVPSLQELKATIKSSKESKK